METEKKTTISVVRSKKIDVEIDRETLKKLVIDFLLQEFDWKRSYFAEKDSSGQYFVWVEENLHSSHSFSQKKKIREASERDKVINEFFKFIK
jgi:hypothetical protein